MAKRHIIPIFVPHMGCPHDCIFCNQRKIAGQSTNMTAEMAENIIKQSISDVKCEIAFYGGSFTAIEREERLKLLETAYKFVESGQVDCIRISTRPDCISKDILHELKTYGVKIIELGAQSMCDDVLNFARRGHTAEHVRNASKLIRDEGFELGLQIMVGLPLDNREKTRYTAKEIAEICPDFTRIYPVVVIEDTYLEELYKKNEYQPISLEKAVLHSADILEILGSIPVIRIGLNPTEELSEKAIGAYHPALGEMVYSELMYRNIVKHLESIQIKDNSDISIYVNFKELSKAIGQKKSNIKKLMKLYPKNNILIKAHDDKDFTGICIKV